MCMWTCLGREAKGKVDVTDRCIRSYRETGCHCSRRSDPRVLVCGEVVAVLEPQAGEGIFLSLRMVIAGAGRPFGWPQVNPYRLVTLCGLVSPQW
jgi:hypothetical protein